MDTTGKKRSNWRLVSLLVAGTGIALLVMANVHLVYVAVKSQPQCVPHAKHLDGTTAHRAARSAC